MADRDHVEVEADALMDRIVALMDRESNFGPTDWRKDPNPFLLEFMGLVRDALRTEATRAGEAMREAVKAAIKESPRMVCPFDGPCDLDPTEPCPTCGDLGTVKAGDEPPNCGDSTYALLKLIDALPLSDAPASPWRVKKLEWRKPADHPQDPEDAALVAVGIGGRYAISKAQLTTAFGPNGHLLWDAEDNFSFTEHRTIETAKAAAQADYEARIRSAIELDLPTPPAKDEQA